LLSSDFQRLKEDIRRWAAELGFQDLGVTDLDLSAHAPHVSAWLEQGFQGEMGYLTRNLAKRLDPDLLHPGTVRIISARMDYLKTDTQPATRSVGTITKPCASGWQSSVAGFRRRRKDWIITSGLSPIPRRYSKRRWPRRPVSAGWANTH
jgi:epoxyqueuosine reductase QueG